MCEENVPRDLWTCSFWKDARRCGAGDAGFMDELVTFQPVFLPYVRYFDSGAKLDKVVGMRDALQSWSFVHPLTKPVTFSKILRKHTTRFITASLRPHLLCLSGHSPTQSLPV